MIKRILNFPLISVAVATVTMLTGCEPATVAVVSTVAVGTVSVRDKEGVTGELSDAYLKKRIQFALHSEDENLHERVELAVKHGIVVVIGSFDDESQCERAMSIVRSVKTEDVYDETKVQPKTDASMFAADTGITTRIDSSMRADGNVSSLNYDLTTVNGVVYICGTAMTVYERDVVLNIARSTSGVKKVVSYIKIAKQEEED